MRILIAVPTYENITPDTFKSIYTLDKVEACLDFDFIRGYDVAAARNRIAKKTIEGKYDYVFMVDNDVTLPHDALVNLLNDPKQVCLGYYAHRYADNVFRGQTNIGKYYAPDGTKQYNFPIESLYTGAEMMQLKTEGKYKIKIHGGGLGAALIRADVFSKFAYPWFKWVNYPSGRTLSEDLYFCVECEKAGVTVYADTRVGCGHLLRQIQWPI